MLSPFPTMIVAPRANRYLPLGSITPPLAFTLVKGEPANSVNVPVVALSWNPSTGSGSCNRTSSLKEYTHPPLGCTARLIGVKAVEERRTADFCDRAG